MRQGNWVFAWALALALLGAGGASFAKKPVKDEAREQFDTGVDLFEKGKFEQAAIAFARAYELRPSFKILYLVGKCENELGHYVASLDAFKKYLAEGGDQIGKKRRDEVQCEIKRLESRIGMIDVKTDIDGLFVYVDGRKAGETPLAAPLIVEIGEHEVQLKRGVEQVHREVVKVAGGLTVAVETEIDAKPSPEALASAQALDGATDASKGERPKRLWTWVAAGVGGAATVAAIVTGVLTLSKSKSIESDCGDDTTCGPEYEDDVDSAKALGYATDALVAVAGVGIAAGVALFFVEPKLAKRESAVAITPVVAPADGGAALGVAGRF